MAKAVSDLSLTINISPATALSPDAIDRALAASMPRVAFLLEGAAKDNVTPFTRTGRLRSSITSRSTSKSATIGTNVNYAAAVEHGSKPHIIRPKNKKALMWATGGKSAAGLGRGPQGTLKGKGSFAFAKVVHHPGFKGHHYMERALKDNAKAIGKLVADEIARSIL